MVDLSLPLEHHLFAKYYPWWGPALMINWLRHCHWLLTASQGMWGGCQWLGLRAWFFVIGTPISITTYNWLVTKATIWQKRRRSKLQSPIPDCDVWPVIIVSWQSLDNEPLIKHTYAIEQPILCHTWHKKINFYIRVPPLICTVHSNLFRTSYCGFATGHLPKWKHDRNFFISSNT